MGAERRLMWAAGEIRWVRRHRGPAAEGMGFGSRGDGRDGAVERGRAERRRRPSLVGPEQVGQDGQDGPLGIRGAVMLRPLSRVLGATREPSSSAARASGLHAVQRRTAREPLCHARGMSEAASEADVECKHGIPAGQCTYCKPRPHVPDVVVITAGGSAFHGQESCEALHDGQRSVERRGGSPAELEKVHVNVAIGKGLVACLWCLPGAGRG